MSTSRLEQIHVLERLIEILCDKLQLTDDQLDDIRRQAAERIASAIAGRAVSPQSGNGWRMSCVSS